MRTMSEAGSPPQFSNSWSVQALQEVGRGPKAGVDGF